MLRNKIQHFASPKNIDCGTKHYIYLIEGLISSEITFLVSPDSIEHLEWVEFKWTDNKIYKNF